jgi:integrase
MSLRRRSRHRPSNPHPRDLRVPRLRAVLRPTQGSYGRSSTAPRPGWRLVRARPRRTVVPRGPADYSIDGWDRRRLAAFSRRRRPRAGIGELLALRWRDVNLAQGRLTVVDSKTDAGRGREIDLWPELREELAVYKADARYAEPVDYVFATATGKADTRWNIAKRLKRAVERANEALADSDTPPIPATLSPHSLRRTFTSPLYLRGENPVYVMHRMGHTDPKLGPRPLQGQFRPLTLLLRMVGWPRCMHGSRNSGLLHASPVR